jgi:hypothetical protein
MKKAISEIEASGTKVKSIYVSDPMPDKFNWCDIMPTDPKVLIEIGIRMERNCDGWYIFSLNH